MNSNVVVENKLEEINGSDTLIVSFCDFTIKITNFHQDNKFDFQPFLDTNFPQYDKFYYRDIKNKYYHFGIDTVSSNIQETVDYLQSKIQNYKKVIFIGASSGGYAAILFGSLLNVNIVITFVPQTIINTTEYSNLQPYINYTTKYYLFGDPLIKHPTAVNHLFHCANIADRDNVIVQEIAGCCNIKKVIYNELLDNIKYIISN